MCFSKTLSKSISRMPNKMPKGSKSRKHLCPQFSQNTNVGTILCTENYHNANFLGELAFENLWPLGGCLSKNLELKIQTNDQRL